MAKGKRVVGHVLREARQKANLSLRDMERLTGMTSSQVSQVETGRRADPAFGTVSRIAIALGISLDDVATALTNAAAAPAPKLRAADEASVRIAAALDEARRNAKRALQSIDEAAKAVPHVARRRTVK